MAVLGSTSDTYLEAFMNGFEFVLLAIRGRLAEADLPEAERARLEAFLADYWRISEAYHARHPPQERRPVVRGIVEADVPAVALN